MYEQLSKYKDTFIEEHDYYGKYLINYKMINRVTCDKSNSNLHSQVEDTSDEAIYDLVFVFIGEDIYRLDFKSYEEVSDAYDRVKSQLIDLKEGVSVDA